MEIIVILALILLNGILSMTEMAFVSSRKYRQHADDRFLSTIQIGITLISILTGLFSGGLLSDDLAAFLSRWKPLHNNAYWISNVLIVTVVTYLTLVMGELVPKRLGMMAADKIARAMSGLMKLLRQITYPFVWLLTKSTRGIMMLFGLSDLKEAKVTEDEIKALIEEGRVEEAERLQLSYTPTIIEDNEIGLDLSSPEALERVERAFSETKQNVLTYPGALGQMWNEHLVRGGFVSFLAPEKRGKTFWLLELSLRAIRQRANVAFFEAGDMTESQILKRICIYVARRSDRERYCQERFSPIGDCVHNQLNTCKRKDRNCDHGIFDGVNPEEFARNFGEFINLDVLSEKFEEFPDYEPCDSKSCEKRWGSVWLRKMKKTSPG